MKRIKNVFSGTNGITGTAWKIPLSLHLQLRASCRHFARMPTLQNSTTGNIMQHEIMKYIKFRLQYASITKSLKQLIHLQQLVIRMCSNCFLQFVLEILGTEWALFICGQVLDTTSKQELMAASGKDLA